jgi:hypothetical protein
MEDGELKIENSLDESRGSRVFENTIPQWSIHDRQSTSVGPLIANREL